MCADDCVLICKRYPVIGDDRAKQERMCLPAFRAPDPADPNGASAFGKEDAAFVIGMKHKAGGVSAGARKLMKREVVNHGIVIILRKMIVILDRYEYHGLVRHSLNGCDWCRDSRTC